LFISKFSVLLDLLLNPVNISACSLLEIIESFQLFGMIGELFRISSNIFAIFVKKLLIYIILHFYLITQFLVHIQMHLPIILHD